jgi:hypothetical protein
MGFFSWKTSDTNKSICNIYSKRPTFKVHMITEDGQVFTELNYEGYGVFGGKDFYTLLAELNGLTTKNEDELRSKAIDLCFENNPSGDYNGKFKMPKLVEELPSKDEDWKKFWDSLDYPESCESQGFFYDDGHNDFDDEDEEW